MTHAIRAVAIAVALLWAPGARAQFGARAEVAPPIVAGSDVDPTASATTVELDDRPRALETTDEVLLEVPGARRRRTGGFGAFTSLSLRGADAEHTQVLLGDVPLASSDGAFDLATVPPWLFDRVEVFRGGAPVWLGAGAIGGVLRLVPRSARGVRVEAVGGGGSWDLAQGRAAASVDGDDASVSAVAGLTHSTGDYELAIDRFPHEPGVQSAHQSNAQLLEASGLVHVRLRSDAGTFSVVGLGLERMGGVPPPMTQWSERFDVRRLQTRGLVAVSGEWLEGGRRPEQADLAAWRAQITAAAGLERRRFSDPHGRIGQLPRASDDRLARYTLRAATTFRIAEWLSASVVAVGSHEHFDPTDALAEHALAPSYRQGGSLAAEARVHGREGDTRWEIRASGRVELLDAHTRDIRPEREDDGRTDALYAMPTARLAGVVELVPGIAISASAATATRAPSSLELFGDGGLLLGNGRLVPEESRTVDGGVVVRGRVGPISGSAEVRGFGLWMSELIRPRVNAQHQIVFDNVTSAWTAGIEASARARFEDWVSLTGAITWLETRDETLGRELPFRPRLTAYARPALHVPGIGPLDRVSAYVDLDYVAGAFNDPASTTPIPEQLYVGAGISLEGFEGRVRIDVVARNLGDARLVDLTERPLPGRSFAMQLAVRTE